MAIQLLKRLFVRVNKTVVRLICNQRVVSSSLISGSKNTKASVVYSTGAFLLVSGVLRD